MVTKTPSESKYAILVIFLLSSSFPNASSIYRWTILYSGLMKKNMKLMKIYEIEKLHQLHRQKLSCIGAANPRLATFQNVCSNVQKINDYRKNRLASDNFAGVERRRVETENRSLHTRMMQVSQREDRTRGKRSRVVPELKPRQNSTTHQKLDQENAKMRERLVRTKSSFQGSRNICHKDGIRDSRKLSHQTEVVQLLERQLRIKPSVVFPVLSPSAGNRTGIKTRRKSKGRAESSKYTVALSTGTVKTEGCC